MQESRAECLRIKDIRPEVFELLLLFVYTDTLPLNEDISFEMTQHLLVAADRYGLGRLKLICEEKLGNCINVENVTATLILANQSNCVQLKEISLDFLASGENLHAVMAKDEFKLLMENCPLILSDLLWKVNSKRGTK
jgi:speckle-type POZ protein